MGRGADLAKQTGFSPQCTRRELTFGTPGRPSVRKFNLRLVHWETPGRSVQARFDPLIDATSTHTTYRRSRQTVSYRSASENRKSASVTSGRGMFHGRTRHLPAPLLTDQKCPTATSTTSKSDFSVASDGTHGDALDAVVFECVSRRIVEIIDPRAPARRCHRIPFFDRRAPDDLLTVELRLARVARHLTMVSASFRHLVG